MRVVPGRGCAHQVRIGGREAITSVGLIGIPDPGIVTGADRPVFHSSRGFIGGTRFALLTNPPEPGRVMRRHIPQPHRVVPTGAGQGLLLAVAVHPVDLQDRDGARLVLARLKHCFPRLRRLWADAGYTDPKLGT